MAKLKLQQITITSKIYTKIHNFTQISNKCTLNTLAKLQNNIFPSFPGTFTKKEAKMQQQKLLTTKHRIFRATKLHQPIFFYMNAVCGIYTVHCLYCVHILTLVHYLQYIHH